MIKFLDSASTPNFKKILQNSRSKSKFFEDLLGDYEYSYIRYKKIYAFALIYLSNGGLSQEFLHTITRQTDKCILIEDHLCCIVFDNITEFNDLKALSNKIVQIEAKHFGNSTYSSIVHRNECESAVDIVNKTFDLLNLAINENYHISLDITYLFN